MAENLRSLPERQAAVAAQQAALAKREKAAYRRGMMQAAVGIVCVSALAVFACLSAVEQARQRQKAEANQYFKNIAAAHRELSEGNYGAAERLLDECPSNLKRWEWHYLDRLCHANHTTFQAKGLARGNGHAGGGTP